MQPWTVLLETCRLKATRLNLRSIFVAFWRNWKSRPCEQTEIPRNWQLLRGHLSYNHPALFSKSLLFAPIFLILEYFSECRKDRNKNFAIVTFLHVNDGLLFLRYYGVESRQKPQQNTHSDFQLNYLLNVSNASHVRKERLFFLKAALVCEPGNK